jgi:aspartyl-tRNA(Asn)/glutamyl-tRNA(Gln) amidotransferase subunit A
MKHALDLVGDPGHLRDLASALRRGETTPRALVDRALERIADVDGAVQAWVSVQTDAARATADALGAEAKAGQWRGALHGIPFAIKDVIDLEGTPTRAGSAARASVAPALIDATIVLRLRAQGAIPLGKVHTTEFAYFDGVPPTRNPHDVHRTPGGSSAGSVAAVASGTVPFALGTQTAGSVNRPAAFCGIGAFKPSGLSVVGAGVVPLSPSFDTVGAFATTAADAAVVVAAMAPEGLGLFLDGPDSAPPVHSVVMLQDPLLSAKMAPAMADAIEALHGRLGATGLPVRHARAPVLFEHLLAMHRTVLLFELGRIHAGLLAHPDAISPRLAADIREGLAVPPWRHAEATADLIAARQKFWASFVPGTVLLAPASPGPAPEGMATGDPSFVIPFTALAGPVASVPAGLCPESGMPLGALLAAAPGQDGLIAALLRRVGL